jgi:Heterokaryon incompatibility protein (HET)
MKLCGELLTNLTSGQFSGELMRNIPGTSSYFVRQTSGTISIGLCGPREKLHPPGGRGANSRFLFLLVSFSTNEAHVTEVGWLTRSIACNLGLPRPFSDFPVKETSDTTASAHSLAKVQKWIKNCETSHVSCTPNNGLTVLPKRILDVSLSRVRLYETVNKLGRYVCLSHCWGAAMPECRTIMKTLKANLTGIPWNTLPATFQDAIDFTRRLGLQYIWIDSICIIQDDAKDWSEQSSLMADIYQNAYVTLCATASAADDGGLYLSTPQHWKTQSIPVRKRNSVEYEVHIRHQMAERHFAYYLGPAWKSEQFPLFTRAWTYQERLLSPRLVYFTAGEVMWECSEVSACECFEPGTNARPHYLAAESEKRLHQKAVSKSRSIQTHWHEMVSRYSALKLSFEKDKLPALSGVAKEIFNIRPGDQYLAGLWGKSILNDLCWSLGDNEGSGLRPSAWRSPS